MTDLDVPRLEILKKVFPSFGEAAQAKLTARKNLRAAFEMPLGRAIDYERQLQTICFATEDAAEGRAAFAERRPPVFRAR